MIEVLHPGVFSSIQDRGRSGYRGLGVPLAGFMDHYSARLANALLANESNTPLIEIAQSGLKLRFHKPALIVLSGSEVQALINDAQVQTNRLLQLKEGDVFAIKKIYQGVWSYLGVHGGLVTKKVLGSYSQFKAVTPDWCLRKDDRIAIKEGISYDLKHSRLKTTNQSLQKKELKVFPGPEYRLLNQKDKNLLFNKPISVTSKSNRMAYEFQQTLSKHGHSILTSPVLPGTVQWTPSGRLFCLMRDAQTTGGYPRILQLAENSVDVLSQKQPGEEFELKIVM